MDTEVPCGKVVPALDQSLYPRWDEFLGGSPATTRVPALLATAAARIRTWEPLRDETLNLAPFPSLATAARPRSPRDVEKDSRSTQRLSRESGHPQLPDEMCPLADGKVHGADGNHRTDALRAPAVRHGNPHRGRANVPAGGVRRDLLDRRRPQGNRRDGDLVGRGSYPGSGALVWPQAGGHRRARCLAHPPRPRRRSRISAPGNAAGQGVRAPAGTQAPRRSDETRGQRARGPWTQRGGRLRNDAGHPCRSACTGERRRPPGPREAHIDLLRLTGPRGPP